MINESSCWHLANFFNVCIYNRVISLSLLTGINISLTVCALRIFVYFNSRWVLNLTEKMLVETPTSFPCCSAWAGCPHLTPDSFLLTGIPGGSGGNSHRPQGRPGSHSQLRPWPHPTSWEHWRNLPVNEHECALCLPFSYASSSKRRFPNSCRVFAQIICPEVFVSFSTCSKIRN